MRALGKVDESLPYLALAYYGTSMFENYGQAPCLPIIQEKAKLHFGKIFS